MKKMTILAGGLALVAAIPALAQPGDRAQRPMDRASAEQRMERRFQMIDSNGDGYVTRAEADAAMAAMQQFRGAGAGGRGGIPGGMDAKAFDEMDADHDGRVSLAEAKAWALARFDAADTNHDGVLSPEERQAANPPR